MTNSPAQAGN